LYFYPDFENTLHFKQSVFKVKFYNRCNLFDDNIFSLFLILINQKILKNSLLGSVLVQFIERNLLAMNFNSLRVKGFEDQSRFEIEFQS
jgi:hypothetical protein